jgi:hypothetical protein
MCVHDNQDKGVRFAHVESDGFLCITLLGDVWRARFELKLTILIVATMIHRDKNSVEVVDTGKN